MKYAFYLVSFVVFSSLGFSSEEHFVVLSCNGVFQHAIPSRKAPPSRPPNLGILSPVLTEDDDWFDKPDEESVVLGGSSKFVFTTKGLGDSLSIWSHRTGKEIASFTGLKENVRSLAYSQRLDILATIDDAGDLNLYFSRQRSDVLSVDLNESVSQVAFANSAKIGGYESHQYMLTNSQSGIHLFRVERVVEKIDKENSDEKDMVKADSAESILNRLETWLKNLQRLSSGQSVSIKNNLSLVYRVQEKAHFSSFSHDGQHLLWITTDVETGATLLNQQNLDILDEPTSLNEQLSFQIEGGDTSKNLSHLSSCGEGSLGILGYQNGRVIFVNFQTRALTEFGSAAFVNQNKQVVSSYCSDSADGPQMITITMNDGSQSRFFWSPYSEPILMEHTNVQRTTLQPKPLGARHGML